MADTGLVTATLERVLAAGATYLDADTACEGLAAAEVVARLRGNWGERNAYTETVDNWVESHPGQPSADLVSAALAAIDRVLTEPSELRELWSETEDFGRWQEAVTELRQRVGSY
jgi:hypothetical protein